MITPARISFAAAACFWLAGVVTAQEALDGLPQLPPGYEDAKVTIVTTDQAIQQLQTEYDAAVRRFGKDSDEARTIDTQIQQIRRRYAQVRGVPYVPSNGEERPTPVATQQATGTEPGEPQSQLTLTAEQMLFLRDRYETLARELGPSDPTVLSLGNAIRRIDEGLARATPSTPADDSRGQPLIPPRSDAATGDVNPSAGTDKRSVDNIGDGPTDPLEVLLDMVRRVQRMEREIELLRDEIRDLKDQAAGATAGRTR